MGTIMKQCRVCKENKEISCFSKSRDKLRNDCKKCHSEYVLKTRDKKEHSERLFKDKLKRLYGISVDQWQRMFDDQNGKCAICNSEPSNVGLCVDHCHNTGKVRGLLCTNCNSGIGKLKDDIAILKNAIFYLEKP